MPFEAGNSTRGTASLAQHKECTFVSSPSKQVVKHYADDTSAAAHAKYQQYRQHVDKDASLAPLSGWTSVDFSTQPLDATLDYIESEAGRSALASFSSPFPGKKWAEREAAEFIAPGGLGTVRVGDTKGVADQRQA